MVLFVTLNPVLRYGVETPVIAMYVCHTAAVREVTSHDCLLLVAQVACDLQRVEVLLELNGPSFADCPDVSDLCFEILSSAAKPAMIVAEHHNSPALAFKYLVHGDDEFVETRC